ncbi:MAG: HU family DNA-binding protein [Prevotella sp.]
MGLGTSKYRKVMRTPQSGENAGKKLWYATAVSDREMNFEDFVTHISEHNSPYSRGTIHGVLMDTLDCLKELILDGKSVRLSDLGLFSIGMTSRGEETREKVTAASVQGVHLIVRNTKNWSNAELKKLTKIVAYDEYVAGEGGGTSGTPGGGSGSGDTTQGGGGTQEGGGSQESGGGTQEGGGGNTDSGDVGF